MLGVESRPCVISTVPSAPTLPRDLTTQALEVSVAAMDSARLVLLARCERESVCVSSQRGELQGLGLE